MLDLTSLNTNLYEVKMLDGTVLHLQRPTQALFMQLSKLGELKTTEEQMEASMPLFAEILNRNIDGKTYTVEELDAAYDFSIAMLVISDYLQFYVKEIQGSASVKN